MREMKQILLYEYMYNKSLSKDIFARYRSMQYGVNREGGITILTVSPVSHNTTVERQSINSAPALS